MKHLSRTALLIYTATLFFTPVTHAAKFANQFIEFELPNAWVCVLEGAEWVCQDQQNKEKKKEAIIVLAAKIQGDQDTLDQYLAYLKNPKVYTTAQGKQVSSDVRYANNKTISDKSWVDSLHLESEIPGFYTRYLATVTDGIGILVTYSVNKNKYQDYAVVFDKMVASLKAFRRDGPGINAAGPNSNLFKDMKMPAGVGQDTVFGVQGASDGEPSRGRGKTGLAALLDDPVFFYGGIAAIALVGLSIVKRKKK